MPGFKALSMVLMEIQVFEMWLIWLVNIDQLFDGNALFLYVGKYLSLGSLISQKIRNLKLRCEIILLLLSFLLSFLFNYNENPTIEEIKASNIIFFKF